MRRAITLLLVFIYFGGIAQTPGRYIVKPGEIPDKVLPAEAVYYFPAFVKGELAFKNGGKSQQRFNYNCLLDELQFLTVGGDTLTIATPYDIMKVNIDSATYYFDKGYLREVYQENGFKLALRERLVQGDAKKEAAYGSTSGTSAISSLESVRIGDNIFRLEAKREILFVKRQAFFLGNRYNQFVPANKKGFAITFSEKKTLIETFIKENKTDFTNPDDLRNLLKSCVE